MKRTQKLFLIKFFIVLVGMYLLVAWNPVNDHVIVPATKVIAQGGGLILKALGQQVDVRGTTISGTRFAVNINNGCNGIEAMLILLAAIGSFPATLRARLVGLGIGALIVQILNEIRIVTLYLIGAYKPSMFQVFHTAVWQVVVILAAIVFFLQWSARVAPARLANGA
jgi:exosortase H (IPTLxxWG-CTERM-specific)